MAIRQKITNQNLTKNLQYNKPPPQNIQLNHRAKKQCIRKCAIVMK